MPLYIIDIGGSAATVGLFSFLSFLPALLVYAFAGVLGDRWNRKAIMVSSDFISGMVTLLLALSAYSGVLTLPLLLSAQVAISLLNGLFDPTTKGILPQLVDSGNLSHANSAAASLRTLSSMAGPVIGTDTLPYFCILSGVLGLLSVALMFINVPVQTIIQIQAPDKYMSRIFSIVGMITKGGLPFGALIYGIVLNRVEIHWTISAATLLIILISGVFRPRF